MSLTSKIVNICYCEMSTTLFKLLYFRTAKSEFDLYLLDITIDVYNNLNPPLFCVYLPSIPCLYVYLPEIAFLTGFCNINAAAQFCKGRKRNMTGLVFNKSIYL